MHRHLVVVAGLLGLILAAATATPKDILAQDRPGVEAVVHEAIEGLDSDDYFRREEATRRLLAAGAPAIRALTAAAETDKLEVTCRAVAILRELLLSSDEVTSEEAGHALERLAESPVTSAAHRAAAALDIRAAVRSRRALAEIARLGGEVRETNNQLLVGQPRLALDKAWKGGDEGLAQLEWVIGMEYLSIRGAPISDAGLVYLEKLSRFSRIELYGTQVTADGANALQAALPGAVVDHRMGGLLGISGATHPRGCIVTRVQPDSAAASVGLQIEDVITRFDGQPISDFESLTALIAKKAGGSKVSLEVVRDEEVLTFEPVLGEWPP